MTARRAAFCCALLPALLSAAAVVDALDPAKSWVSQFMEGASTVSKQYGFTVWKQIDWPARTRLAAHEIAAAEATHDAEALFWAIRKFTFVGDGHIGVADPGKYWQRMFNGSFGVLCATDSAGRVVVVDVTHGSAAHTAGVKRGATILTWGGEPVEAALESLKPWHFFLSAPTLEGQRYSRELLLTRGRIGNKIEANFSDDTGAHVSAQLTAMDDGQLGLVRQLKYNWPFGGPFSPGGLKTLPSEYDGPTRGVEFNILTEPNVGYLKIMTEDTSKADAPSLVADAIQAVARFSRMRVQGVVIDLRGNNGGDDQPSADIVSLFYTGNSSIPYPYKDVQAGTIKPPSQLLPVKKSGADGLPFEGPLSILTDHLCVSDCEGIAFALRNVLGTKRTRFFSWDNSTMGAFGMPNDIDAVKMPGGNDVTTLMKQDGKPLAGRAFLIEADADGFGGIASDVTIPRTTDNLLKRYDGVDLPLQAAIRHLRQL